MTPQRALELALQMATLAEEVSVLDQDMVHGLRPATPMNEVEYEWGTSADHLLDRRRKVEVALSKARQGQFEMLKHLLVDTRNLPQYCLDVIEIGLSVELNTVQDEGILLAVRRARDHVASLIPDQGEPLSLPEPAWWPKR